jgi:hypothetical protein
MFLVLAMLTVRSFGRIDLRFGAMIATDKDQTAYQWRKYSQENWDAIQSDPR